MARFPDQVVLIDTGVAVPHQDGGTGNPAVIVNCLVSVHDTKQEGGTETRVVPIGQTTAQWTVYYPFRVLYDVLLSTDAYFTARNTFRTFRQDPAAQQLRGAGNIPNIPNPTNPDSSTLRHLWPRLYEPDRVPKGVFEYPDRQNVLVAPVEQPGFIDPFGTPLDPDRNEIGLSIEYMMVRKEITRLVCERKVKVF